MFRASGWGVVGFKELRLEFLGGGALQGLRL